MIRFPYANGYNRPKKNMSFSASGLFFYAAHETLSSDSHGSLN